MKWFDPKNYPFPLHDDFLSFTKVSKTELGIIYTCSPEYNGRYCIATPGHYEDYIEIKDIIAWIPIPNPPPYEIDLYTKIKKLEKEVLCLRKLIIPNGKSFYEKMEEIREEYNRKNRTND